MKPIFRFTLSTAIVIGFGVILLFLAVVTEMFQNKNKELDLADIYTSPLPKNSLKKIKSIKLVNKNGEFLMLNQDPSGELSIPWQLYGEAKLEIKTSVIEKIFDSLKNMRIRNFHRLEQINLTSFSINNPTMELHLTNLNNESTKILMGLINPIDNSAYVTIGDQKQIYQIDPLSISLENYDVQDLTSESKSIESSSDSILSLEIYHTKGLFYKITKKENQWIDMNGMDLDEKKVVNFIQQFEKLKNIANIKDLEKDEQERLTREVNPLSFQFKLISDKKIKSYVISKLNQQPGKYLLQDEDKTPLSLLTESQLKIFNEKVK